MEKPRFAGKAGFDNNTVFAGLCGGDVGRGEVTARRGYSLTTLTVLRFLGPLISNNTVPGAVANSV